MLHDVWDALGGAKGYVVGAAVTALALIINNLISWALDGSQAKRTEKAAVNAWNREREARFQELRRETYAEVVSICERRFFRKDQTKDEQSRAKMAWYGARAKVRFVTDRRDVIEAADAMITAAGADPRVRGTFRTTRTNFVTVSREELGLAQLPLATTLPVSSVVSPPQTLTGSTTPAPGTVTQP